jgi:hypothetical protein
MRALAYVVVGVTLVVSSPGCNDHERLAVLEKENTEIKAELTKQRETASLDLQQKCSTAAKTWFRDNFAAPEKYRIMIDYSNHYNQKQRRCFILVEYHMRYTLSGPWTNLVGVWDVMENNQVAEFSESHSVGLPPNYEETTRVGLCKVTGTECHSLDEYNTLTRPLMSN